MSTLMELNEYLFDALNAITNEDLLEEPDEKFQKTIKVAKATTDIASKIIDINRTAIEAEKVKQEYGLDRDVVKIGMDQRKG